MMDTKSRETSPSHDGAQHAMELVIGYVLLGGVVVSAALIAAGAVWHGLRTGRLGIEYSLPRTNLFEFVAAQLRELAAGHAGPRLLIGLGIAALLLTPYLRVLASLIFFAFVERNAKYALFTGFVLAVLTYSLFLR